MSPNPHIYAAGLAARLTAQIFLFLACVAALRLGGTGGSLAVLALHFVYFMFIVTLQVTTATAHEAEASRWRYVLTQQMAISHFIQEMARGAKPQDIDWRKGATDAVADIQKGRDEMYPRRSGWWLMLKVAGTMCLLGLGAVLRTALAMFFI